MFYREVVQAILMYGLDMWFLLAAIEKKSQGTHMGLLRQIMGKQSRRIVDGEWDTPGSEVVREAAGTKSAMIYIWRR